MVDSSMFRAIGFGLKNVDNTQNGHPGKVAVAGGQIRNAAVELKNFSCVRNCFNSVYGDIRNVFYEAQKVDDLVGKSAKTAIEAMHFAKGEKIFDYAGKALNFAGDHINPLICVSAGLDVALSDDKEKTFVENTLGLTTMFATEKLMKEHLSDVVKIKGVDKIADSVMKAVGKTKYGKFLPAIVHGATFIAGSCTAYAAGQKFGNLLMGGDKKQQVASAQREAVA